MKTVQEVIMTDYKHEFRKKVISNYNKAMHDNTISNNFLLQLNPAEYYAIQLENKIEELEKVISFLAKELVNTEKQTVQRDIERIITA